MFLLLASGCASLSNRDKILITMGVVGVAAGTAGALLIAPPEDNKLPHAGLWGGLGAATAGIASLFIFDEEAKRKEAEVKIAKLEKEIASMKEETAPELIATNHVGASKPLPEKYRSLVTPGQWSLYQVDRWVSSSDSELVHQDLIFRFHQPQLNPSGKLPAHP